MAGIGDPWKSLGDGLAARSLRELPVISISSLMLDRGRNPPMRSQPRFITA